MRIKKIKKSKVDLTQGVMKALEMVTKSVPMDFITPFCKNVWFRHTNISSEMGNVQTKVIIEGSLLLNSCDEMPAYTFICYLKRGCADLYWGPAAVTIQKPFGQGRKNYKYWDDTKEMKEYTGNMDDFFNPNIALMEYHPNPNHKS